VYIHAVKYPALDVQYTYKSIQIQSMFDIASKLKPTEILKRNIFIKYRALSDKTEYHFESQGQFDTVDKVWRDALQKAD